MPRHEGSCSPESGTHSLKGLCLVAHSSSHLSSLCSHAEHQSSAQLFPTPHYMGENTHRV